MPKSNFRNVHPILAFFRVCRVFCPVKGRLVLKIRTSNMYFRFRERELNPNFFFSNFSGAPGISRQNPGISRQKSLISLVSRAIPNFLAPTPSCGRPPPHRKISGLKSLGLGSFFMPEDYLHEEHVIHTEALSLCRPLPEEWPHSLYVSRWRRGLPEGV